MYKRASLQFYSALIFHLFEGTLSNVLGSYSYGNTDSGMLFLMLLSKCSSVAA